MTDTNAGLMVEMGKGLDSYMAAADETAAELLQGDDGLVAALRRYDDYLRRDLWAHVARSSAIGFILQMNAYMVFLAGVRMALSGHPAAVFPLLRTALESASYGLLIERNPVLADVWTHRHRSEADKKACRKAIPPSRDARPPATRPPRSSARSYRGPSACQDPWPGSHRPGL